MQWENLKKPQGQEQVALENAVMQGKVDKVQQPAEAAEATAARAWEH